MSATSQISCILGQLVLVIHCHIRLETYSRFERTPLPIWGMPVNQNVYTGKWVFRGGFCLETSPAHHFISIVEWLVLHRVSPVVQQELFGQIQAMRGPTTFPWLTKLGSRRIVHYLVYQSYKKKLRWHLIASTPVIQLNTSLLHQHTTSTLDS